MSLFGDVERMINLAKDALCNQKIELVDTIIASDAAVDEREVEIEEDCLKILALPWNASPTSPATLRREPEMFTSTRTSRFPITCQKWSTKPA